MTVTFVCTGNTCRSPMGEAILKKMAEEQGWKMRVESAGLFAHPGSPVAENARRALSDLYGISSFHHASQPMTQSLFDASDLVIAMTAGHARLLTERFGVYDKILSMPTDVDDPWGGDLAAYKKSAGEIEKGIRILVERGTLHA